MTVLVERGQLVQWIEEAVVAGARLAPACIEADICIRTHQRWTRGDTLRADARPQALRPTPANKLSEEERAVIIAIANEARFASLPPSQIVPRLADENVYIGSESSFYRVLNSADQLHHRGRAKAPVKRVATTHVAYMSNEVWCWDVTYLPAAIRGEYFYLHLMLDLYSRKVVGWEVHAEENGENASVLLKRSYLAESIGLSGKPLVLHADNGAPMKSSTLLTTMQNLGVMPSYSRPRVSDDNAYVESFFRTCKYRPDYPAAGFANVEDARTWVLQFVRWYNGEHRHSGIKFVTPQQRHQGDDVALLAQRCAVYAAAKQRHPQRWSGEIRNWSPVTEVWLNPERQPQQEMQQAA